MFPFSGGFATAMPSARCDVRYSDWKRSTSRDSRCFSAFSFASSLACVRCRPRGRGSIASTNDCKALASNW